MEAKLIKENNFYKLIKDNTVLVKINTNEPIDIHYSFGELSLKNCQAIELGYDLDEVILEEFPYDFDIPLFETLGITEKVHKNILIGMLQGTLQKGFQKALEILGDKKFSENDIRNAWDTALNQYLMFHEIPATAWREQHIQSLQQTEWDVEICCYVEENNGWIDADTFNSPILIGTGEPKLDADGCLILKRK